MMIFSHGSSRKALLLSSEVENINFHLSIVFLLLGGIRIIPLRLPHAEACKILLSARIFVRKTELRT